MTNFFVCLFAFCVPSLLSAQILDQTEQEKRRQEKIDDILRITDLRTPHDAALVRYLTDDDPTVRARATLAYGSLQDTSVIGLLTKNLTEGTESVQLAAAFAIGQTGIQLSPTGREALQYDLIWKRLPQTFAGDRLVEEIGKFGTQTALDDLVLHIGNSLPLQYQHGLTMAIARFAMRGVVTTDGIRFLLRFIRPAESTPWEVAYALQRAGDQPATRQEIDQLVLLHNNPDPLVRMYLATLLGELKDKRSSLTVLNTMAEYDRDWRVRVNAARALGYFDLRGEEQTIETLRRTCLDQVQHVQVTALAALGNSGLDSSSMGVAGRPTLALLRLLTENRSGDFHWQIQGEAAAALARLTGEESLPLLESLNARQPHLHAMIVRALGAAGSLLVADRVLDDINSSDPAVACAALEALQRLVHLHPHDHAFTDRVYAAILGELQNTDVAIVTTAASILSDSLLLRTASASPLLESLPRLHIPDDIEAIQQVMATLGKLRDSRAMPVLLGELKSIDRSVAFAAASALRDITGRDYRASVYLRPEPVYTDLDFRYLSSLPSVVHVTMETIRGNIRIELYRDVAPFTVLSFLKLARGRGFYRGLMFHRVVPNFVVQGGDPRGDGWGGPGYTIRSEFSPLRFETGTLGIASAGKDTEGSQFFITHSPQPHLDGRYTIFGKVLDGMDIVDRILVDDHILDVIDSRE